MDQSFFLDHTATATVSAGIKLQKNVVAAIGLHKMLPVGPGPELKFPLSTETKTSASFSERVRSTAEVTVAPKTKLVVTFWSGTISASAPFENDITIDVLPYFNGPALVHVAIQSGGLRSRHSSTLAEVLGLANVDESRFRLEATKIRPSTRPKEVLELTSAEGWT